MPILATVTSSDTRRRLLRWWPYPLAFFAVLLRVTLAPTTIERVYSRGAFPLIRIVFDTLLGWVPVPLFYVFWLLIIGLVLRSIWRYIQARKQGARRAGAVGSLLEQWGRGLCILLTVFLLGWGMNYGRLPVEDVMVFDRYSPTPDELREFVYTEAAKLATLRSAITTDTNALTDADFPTDLEAAVRPLVAATLVKHAYPAPGTPHARQLSPSGILLRWSTAGVYWPWAFEGNIDAGLHPLQKPSVMAHELSHAYGFGDEGTCSFWAVLAGRQTDDRTLRYAYRLDYWRRMAGKLRRAEPEAYWSWRAKNLAPSIRNDLQAIYDNSARYQSIAPALRDATYNTYLKAQGVHGGMLSYGTVIELVEGYRRRRQ